MTDSPNQTDPAPAAVPAPAVPPPAGPTRTNVLGIVALAAAVIGFVFACLPGALVVGWVLLPIAFILGIVALFLRGRWKWTAVTAVIVSVVGTIVGFVVFFAAVAGAISDAVDENGGGDVVVSAPSAGGDVPAEEPEAPAAEPQAPSGTREDPLALGSTVENADWSVTVTGIDPNGNAAVASANQFNDAPGAGQQYVIVDASATYKGSGEGVSAEVQIDYVTADGTVLSTWDNIVVGIEPEFGRANLYAGATDAGKLVFLVPSSLDGQIRVRPGLFAGDVFFALS